MSTLDFYNSLQTVEYLSELQQWSRELYESGLLDESEQCWGPYGPMAPWAFPLDAIPVDGTDNGEDFTVMLISGEQVRWINSLREWIEPNVSDAG